MFKYLNLNTRTKRFLLVEWRNRNVEHGHKRWA